MDPARVRKVTEQDDHGQSSKSTDEEDSILPTDGFELTTIKRVVVLNKHSFSESQISGFFLNPQLLIHSLSHQSRSAIMRSEDEL